MKEWIVGRNPVFETLKARRREVFRLWVASGVQEKGRIQEILSTCNCTENATFQGPALPGGFARREPARNSS